MSWLKQVVNPCQAPMKSMLDTLKVLGLLRLKRSWLRIKNWLSSLIVFQLIFKDQAEYFSSNQVLAPLLLKNFYSCRGRNLWCQGWDKASTLAIEVNTNSLKKGNKENKDLSQVKYYNYQQIDYYANKYPKKSRN